MTNAMHICYLCETAEAEALKTEMDREQADDENCSDVLIPVTRPICLACNDLHFDGTEDVPALLPLH